MLERQHRIGVEQEVEAARRVVAVAVVAPRVGERVVGLPWQRVSPGGAVPIGRGAVAVDVGLDDVAGQQRLELLGIADEVEVAGVDDGRALRHRAAGGGLVADPRDHLVDLVLAAGVVAAAGEVAVDEQHRPAERGRHVHEHRRLLGDLVPRLQQRPEGGRHEVAVLVGVPPLRGAGGQPVVEEVLDLRGRRVAALAEQVDVRVDGLDDALESGAGGCH